MRRKKRRLLYPCLVEAEKGNLVVAERDLRDLENATCFCRELEKYVSKYNGNVLLDLTNVEHIGITALAGILVTQEGLQLRNYYLCLEGAGNGSQVRGVIKMSGLEGAFIKVGLNGKGYQPV